MSVPVLASLAISIRRELEASYFLKKIGDSRIWRCQAFVMMVLLLAELRAIYILIGESPTCVAFLPVLIEP